MICNDYCVRAKIPEGNEPTRIDVRNPVFMNSSDLISQPSEPTVQTTLSNVLLHFENLNVGDRWLSPWREVTGDDVAEFAVLTGDEDPLHTTGVVDSPFGRPVAHGLLGLSLMAGMSSQHPRVATLALTEVLDWRFDKPIYFGDQIRVLTEVESLATHGRRAGRVVWKRQLLNQDDRVVQQGKIVTLVARGQRPEKNASDLQRDSAETAVKSPNPR
jgi:3-hydroxybutyryl-CoA dehydratase